FHDDVKLPSSVEPFVNVTFESVNGLFGANENAAVGVVLPPPPPPPPPSPPQSAQIWPNDAGAIASATTRVVSAVRSLDIWLNLRAIWCLARRIGSKAPPGVRPQGDLQSSRRTTRRRPEGGLAAWCQLGAGAREH